MKVLPEKIEEQRVILIILSAALLIRMIYILEILNTPFSKFLYSDPKLYYDFASLIISSEFWSGNDPFMLSPLYPIILSLFQFISDKNNFAVYIFQAFLSTGVILIIYHAARNLCNANVALISALTAAFFDAFVFYTGMLTYETVEVFLVSVLIFYFSSGYKKTPQKYLFLTGIILGFLIIVRESYLLLMIVSVIYISIAKNRYFSDFSSLKLIGPYLFGVIIVIMPFTISNLVLSSDLVITNTNGGINFYMANNEDAKGYFHSPVNFDYEEDSSGKELASNYLNKTVTPSEASSYWYERTISEIFSEPHSFIERGAKKIFMFFDSMPYSYSSVYDISFYSSNFSELLKFPLLSYGVLALLSIFGFVFYIRSKNKNSFIIIYLITYLIIIIFSFANLRFRMGLTPIMIILAASGVIEIVNIFKSYRYKELALPATILFIIIIVNTFFISKPDINNYDAYYQLARYAEEESRYEEAIYNYNRSILLNDKYASFLNLGNTFAKKKDFPNALSAYTEAEKRNSNDYFLFFNKGIVLTQTGRYDEALEAYNTALQLNPTHYPIYRNIGIIYYVSNNYNEAQKYFKRFISLSDDEETKELVKKDLENIRLKLQNN